MSTDQTVPKHEYETVAGTPATPYAQHEPRTVAHRIVRGDETDLAMMTEIGDGTFVQWTECRRCNHQVATCTCPDGPAEPDYMARWRDKRFGRDLNRRPDPEYPLLPSILEWVTERGYVIGKADIANGLFVKLFEAMAACEAPEGTQVDDVLADFQDAYLEATGRTLIYQGDEVVGHTYAVPPGSDPIVVDSLTEAMGEVVEKVKAEAMAAEEGSPEDVPASQDPDNLTGMDLGDGLSPEPTEDDLDFARDTLGPDATEDEVVNLANQRADRDMGEFDAGF